MYSASTPHMDFHCLIGLRVYGRCIAQPHQHQPIYTWLYLKSSKPREWNTYGHLHSARRNILLEQSLSKKICTSICCYRSHRSSPDHMALALSVFFLASLWQLCAVDTERIAAGGGLATGWQTYEFAHLTSHAFFLSTPPCRVGDPEHAGSCAILLIPFPFFVGSKHLQRIQWPRKKCLDITKINVFRTFCCQLYLSSQYHLAMAPQRKNIVDIEGPTKWNHAYATWSHWCHRLRRIHFESSDLQVFLASL